jgi:ABC-type lipopolysaccharide export system ATPase subunit
MGACMACMDHCFVNDCIHVGEILADRSSIDSGWPIVRRLKRRVELAKGLMHSPRVLLLDEPTSGLDPRARQEFWELVTNQVRGSGTTVIVATHLDE